MKNILKIIFLLTFISFNVFFIPTETNAKTLGDLKAELNRVERENKETKEEIHKTESEINKTRQTISQIYVDMDNISKEIIAKTKEIEELDIEIKEKDQETKELLKFMQISTSDNVYLEYIMGSDTLTDFIYRISIAEQLSKYNSDLIDEMNGMIKANEKKQVELAKQNENLKAKQENLRFSLNSLGQAREELYEFNRSLEDEIATARQVIQMYEKAGCKEHENINTCARKLLPPDTRFWRPMTQGVVTSEYGYRIHPIFRVPRLHDGIDLTNSDRFNTRVYATANGRVAKIGYDSAMGNYIIIHHNINNVSYTSQYLHLKSGSISVSEGNVVSKDTVLALMGTTGSSTGEHLHFAIARGHRYKDYYTYSDFVSRTIDPRNVVNFPTGLRVWWVDRVSRYN